MPKVLNKEEVTKALDEIFKKAMEENDRERPVINVFEYFLQVEWDKVEKVENWPSVSKPLHEHLFKKFIDLDNWYVRNNKDKVERLFVGGLWMNYGFSYGNELDHDDDWVIDIETCTVKMLGDINEQQNIETVSQ